MKGYKSKYCENCWYKSNADAGIQLYDDINKIKPCDLCDGEIAWIWEKTDIAAEFPGLNEFGEDIDEVAGTGERTFGGARSHDIHGGVLDIDDVKFKEKKKAADKSGLPYRVNHVSWWAEEMPSEEEMQIGRDNLEKNNWKVDYIVTHDCAASTKALIGHGFYKTDELNQYLEEIRQKCEFKKWLFGHLHDNRQINDKEVLLYEQIVRIW